VAFEDGEAIWVWDASDGHLDKVLDKEPHPLVFRSRPLLSYDGRVMAVLSSSDLDPRVGTEERSPELFLIELESGSVSQVTDRSATPYALEFSMNHSADSFLVTGQGGELFGLGIRPFTVHLFRRDPDNQSPQLVCPTVVDVAIGASAGNPVDVVIEADDPEGSRVILYAEFVDKHVRDYRAETGLRFFASTFTDTGDGVGRLAFAPRAGQVGEYLLRFAAFDQDGGAKTCDTRIRIGGTVRDRDANCDGEISPADVSAVISEIFAPSIGPCQGVDANADGLVSAADVSAVVSLLRVPSPH
jgi:hypothetical protein